MAALFILISCGRPRQATRAPASPQPVVVPAVPQAVVEAERPQRPPAKFDHPVEAAEFFRQQRVQGDGPLPAERYLEGMRHTRAMRRVSLRQGNLVEMAPRDATGGLGAWQELGPGNVGGRTRAVVIHPQDPNIMYAGGATGGVWKTADGGKNWAPQTDFAPVLALNSLTMSPWDSNLLYAGTGEQTQGWRGAGIFRTSDGGGHWAQLSSTANSDFYYVNKIAVSLNTAPRVYAATSTGLWTSADGGDTWSKTLATGSSGCYDLALQPGQAKDVAFAVCQLSGSSPYAVYRNLDAANAFSPWVTVLTDPQMYTTALAIAPSQPSTIYAVSVNVSSSAYPGALFAVYRSTSNGDTPSWTKQVSNSDTPSLNTAILSSSPAYGLSGYCNAKSPLYNGQGSYNLYAAVDPLDPNRLWAAGVGLFRSDDGGVTWGYAQNGNHPDQHFLAFPPGYDGGNNQTIISGNDGGVYQTTQGRGKTGTCADTSTSITWTPLNNSYGTTQFYHGVPYPGGGSYFGGTQDNGTVRGIDTGSVNQWNLIYGGDGGVSRIDPTDPTTLFAEYVNLALVKSTDGGFSYKDATAGIAENPNNFQFIAYYTFDPNNSLRMYIGATQLWRTEDGAASWKAAGAPNPKVSSSNDVISAIAASPADPNMVLYGTTHGNVFRNSNALAADGTTVWAYTQPRSGSIKHLEFDPGNPNTVYATYTTFKSSSTDNHIYRSTNGGFSWTGIDGSGSSGLPDVPVETLLVDPDDSSHLYAGTDLGIFASLDGGGTWVNVDNPFPNTITTNLVIDRTGGAKYLYVFTYGRGVWRVPMGTAPSTCGYTVQAAVPVPATGGTVSADISTDAGCAWSVIPQKSAGTGFTVQSPGSGVGGGKAYFNVLTNTSISLRSASFTVQNKAIVLTQQGASQASIGDELATALAVPSLPYQDFTNNNQLTQNASDPKHSCTGSADFKTGWFVLTAPADGSVQVAAQGSALTGGNSGIVLTAYPYANQAIGQELGCTVVAQKTGTLITGTISFAVTAGKQYAIEIGATGSTSAYNALLFFGATTAPALTAAVTPATVTVNTASKQQFAARIGGLGNTAVRWTVSPPVGFVTPAGLYTAPAVADSSTAVTVTAISLANPALYGEAKITLQPAPLTVAAGGTLNAASFLGGGVAPGEIITIFGASMGPVDLITAQLDAQGNVAGTLGGTQVLFDGIASPMVYSYASQVCAVVPYEVAGHATTQMVVTRNGQRSPAVTLPVVATAPALFTYNASGTGLAAIFNQDGLTNALFAAPRGSLVTLFGTGEGQTNPPGFDGRVASADPPKPAAPLSVQIGGVDAEIQYQGGAPFEVAGVLQVNVVVPQSVPPGVNPVVLKVGGAASPTLTMNVLGPDGRIGSVAYNNGGVAPLTLTVYKPDAPNTPIPVGTVQPGSYTIYPSIANIGNDWYLQVNGSPMRVISQVCTFTPTSSFGPYWACAGTSSTPFPR